PIVLWLGADGASFTARGRTAGGRVLTFARDTVQHVLRDAETRSAWNEDGACVAGALRGTRLEFVRSSQEFWHSWRQFHPATDTNRPPRGSTASRQPASCCRNSCGAGMLTTRAAIPD